MPKPEKHVFICLNARPPGHPKGSCMARDAQDIITEFVSRIEDQGLKGRFRVTRTSCLGPCENGPIVLVYPESVMYGGVSVSDVAEIIDHHLVGNRPVERLRVPASLW